MSFERFYLNRTICCVLEEMRSLDKTKNYSSLLGLIEEAQTMANRMEAGLEYKKDIESFYNKKKELRKQLLKLEKEIDDLKEVRDSLKDKK